MKDWPILGTIITALGDEQILGGVAAFVAAWFVAEFPIFVEYQDLVVQVLVAAGSAAFIERVFNVSAIFGSVWEEHGQEISADLGEIVVNSINPIANRIEGVVQGATGLVVDLDLSEDELEELQPVLEEFFLNAGYSLLQHGNYVKVEAVVEDDGAAG